MSGIDLNTIRDILGQKSLGMVLQYAHLPKSHQANAVSILGKQMYIMWSPEVMESKNEANTEVVSFLVIVGSEFHGAVAKW